MLAGAFALVDSAGAAILPRYYVDAQSGDDGNSGATPAAPWRSLARVSRTAFPSGATLYLRRGGTWNEPLVVSSDNITIDAYGAGALPTIDGSVTVREWMPQGAGVYGQRVALGSGDGLGNVSKDGAMLIFVPWRQTVAATFAAAPYDSFAYAYPDMLYVKVAGDPATGDFRASVRLYGVRAEGRSGIAVKNVHITRFSLHGVELSDCRSCSVSSALIDRGGGAVVGLPPAYPDYLYAGNGVQFGNASTDGAVTGCAIAEIFDSGISPQTFASGQAAGRFTFSGDTIDRAGFAGIEISVLSHAGAAGSTIDGVTLADDVVTRSGGGWSGRRYGSEGVGIRIAADAGGGSISGIGLRHVNVSGSAADALRLVGAVGTVTVEASRLHDNAGAGIALSDAHGGSRLALALRTSLVYGNRGGGIVANAPEADGLEIYQDTFTDNGAINVAILSRLSSVRIENNIFHGTTPMAHLYVAVVPGALVLDHDCYEDGHDIIGYGGQAFASVAQFAQATGFESAGIGGPVSMIDPVAGHLMLAASSSCRGLGDGGLAIASDFSGYAYALPPAAGAYEYR